MSRQLYQWCKIRQKVVPIDEVIEEVSSNAISRFTSDEMPPTRSPISGKYYTSKSRLRAEYKAHGAIEIGNEYQNGYDPGKEYFKQKEREVDRKIHESFKRHLNRD